MYNYLKFHNMLTIYKLVEDNYLYMFYNITKIN